MCDQYSPVVNTTELGERFGFDNADAAYSPCYDVAPTQGVLAAVAIRPYRAVAYLNIAAAHLERGPESYFDRALNSLDEAISYDPGYPIEYINRAARYVMRGGPGDLELALGDLDKALEIELEMAAAHLNRSIACPARRSGGDFELAIGEFSRSMDLAPSSSMANFDRGLIHSELDNWTKSLSGLRRAH